MRKFKISSWADWLELAVDLFELVLNIVVCFAASIAVIAFIIWVVIVLISKL